MCVCACVRVCAWPDSLGSFLEAPPACPLWTYENGHLVSGKVMSFANALLCSGSLKRLVPSSEAPPACPSGMQGVGRLVLVTVLSCGDALLCSDSLKRLAPPSEAPPACPSGMQGVGRAASSGSSLFGGASSTPSLFAPPASSAGQFVCISCMHACMHSCLCFVCAVFDALTQCVLFSAARSSGAVALVLASFTPCNTRQLVGSLDCKLRLQIKPDQEQTCFTLVTY
eukprot:1136714-Pelagomonas_calceolata.AAC.4